MPDPVPETPPASDAAAPASRIEPTTPSIWAAVKESVRGAHRHDYTSGGIGHSLLLLAVPMVLEVALESVFAVVNVFWVGSLGPAAVATVGLT
jgi:hypothetical protein